MAQNRTWAVSQSGIERRLLIHASAMLVDRHDAFVVEVGELNISIAVHFDDAGEQYGMTGGVSDDGKSINLICHKWNNPQYVENVKPLEYVTIGAKKIVWIKVRSSADVHQSFRSVELSVWIQS